MAINKSFWFTPKGLAALAFIGAASYFLLIEHREHLVAWLPFLILALCPLMHLFMHGGHGKHHHGEHDGHQHSGEAPDREEAYRQGDEAGRRQAGHKREGEDDAR